MSTAQEGLHPEDVKAQLRKRGTSLAQLARELDVSIQAVSAVLWGHLTSARIEEALAEAAGMGVEEIKAIERPADAQPVSPSVSPGDTPSKRPRRRAIGNSVEPGVSR